MIPLVVNHSIITVCNASGLSYAWKDYGATKHLGNNEGPDDKEPDIWCRCQESFSNAMPVCTEHAFDPIDRQLLRHGNTVDRSGALT